MKRPAFQFYPADWRNNAKLRRCSWAARGVWVEVMGLMHDSDEYGVLRWPLKEIAQALGAPMAVVNELVAKGVMYGCAKGDCEPMVFTPKHGRTLGAPVTLIPAQPGPIWYSPRMVRDEYVRTKRGASTRFGGGDDGPPNHVYGDADDRSPMGGFGDGLEASPNRRQGDGPSSSSSSSSSEIGSSSRESPNSIPGQASIARAVLEATKALRQLGMLDVHPSRPELIQAIQDGATVDQLADTARELRDRPGTEMPNLKYVVATLRGRAKDQINGGGSGQINGDNGSAGAGGRRQGTRAESASERAEREYWAAQAREAGMAEDADAR